MAGTHTGGKPTREEPDYWWFNRPNGSMGALPPRAMFQTDAPHMTLDGDWAFQAFPTVQSALDFCS